jgi:hypothetical protein
MCMICVFSHNIHVISIGQKLTCPIQFQFFLVLLDPPNDIFQGSLKFSICRATHDFALQVAGKNTKSVRPKTWAVRKDAEFCPELLTFCFRTNIYSCTWASCKMWNVNTRSIHVVCWQCIILPAMTDGQTLVASFMHFVQITHNNSINTT